MIASAAIQKVVGKAKAPPKPEAAKKKEERDVKISNALKDLREKRRAETKAKKEAAAKRAQEQEDAHNKSVRAEIDLRREVFSLPRRPSSTGRSMCRPPPRSPS